MRQFANNLLNDHTAIAEEIRVAFLSLLSFFTYFLNSLLHFVLNSSLSFFLYFCIYLFSYFLYYILFCLTLYKEEIYIDSTTNAKNTKKERKKTSNSITNDVNAK
jgi:phosphoglycerol transferase MdoB-like AlkP superfamily enzyme